MSLTITFLVGDYCATSGHGGVEKTVGGSVNVSATRGIASISGSSFISGSNSPTTAVYVDYDCNGYGGNQTITLQYTNNYGSSDSASYTYDCGSPDCSGSYEESGTAGDTNDMYWNTTETFTQSSGGWSAVVTFDQEGCDPLDGISANCSNSHFTVWVSGSGPYTVNVSPLSANTYVYAEMGTVYVYNLKGSLIGSFDVWQEKREEVIDYYLIVNPTVLTWEWNDTSSKNITVTSYKTVDGVQSDLPITLGSLTGDSSRFTTSQSNIPGSSDKRVTVTPTGNNEGTSNYGSGFTISNEGTSQSVTLTQKYKPAPTTVVISVRTNVSSVSTAGVVSVSEDGNPSNSASSNTTAPASITINIGSTFSLYAQVLSTTEYEFGGWGDGNFGVSRSGITATSDATYVALFNKQEARTYTVTVYYDDGIISVTVNGATIPYWGYQMTVTEGDTISWSSTFKSGYEASSGCSGTHTVYSDYIIDAISKEIVVAPVEYTVLVFFDEGITCVTVNGVPYYTSGASFKVNSGTQISWSSTFVSGYEASSGCSGSTIVSGNYTINAVSRKIPVVEPNKYKVTIVYATNTGGCQADGGSRSDGYYWYVNEGDSASATFSSKTGYHYGSSNGTTTNTVSASNIRSDVELRDTNPSINQYTVTVVFTSLTASCTANGSPKNDGDSWLVNHGGSASATFTCNEGYHYGASNPNTNTSNTVSATNITSDVYLRDGQAGNGTSAAITENQYKVTIAYATNTASCTANGGSRSNGYSWSVKYNASASATFTCKTGYHYGTNASTTTNTVSASNIKSDTTLQDANANPNAYTLSLAVSPSGSGTVSGGSLSTTSSTSGTVYYGDNLTISASPGSNYNFSKWSGSSTSTNASISATVTSNLSFTGNFTQKPAETVTISVAFTDYTKDCVDNNGTPRSAGESWTVNKGSNVSATFTCIDGYHYGANSPNSNKSNTVSASNVQVNTVLRDGSAGNGTSAAITADKFTLTITVNTGVASISVTGTGAAGTYSSGTTTKTVSYGTTISWTATAASGYTMDTSSGSFTVTGDCSIAPTGTPIPVVKASIRLMMGLGVSSVTIAGNTYTASTTIQVDPGTYTWTAVYQSGYTGTTSGSITAEAGITKILNVMGIIDNNGTVEIEFNEGVSSITFNGTTYYSNTTLTIAAGSYSWSAIPQNGYTIRISSGTATVTAGGTTRISPLAQLATQPDLITINFSCSNLVYSASGHSAICTISCDRPIPTNGTATVTVSLNSAVIGLKSASGTIGVGLYSGTVVFNNVPDDFHTSSATIEITSVTGNPIGYVYAW